MSVEEYLGRNTQAYYDVLGLVGGGSWQPERDTRVWIRFILTAHLRQAQTLQRRVKASERVWVRLESLVRERALPERSLAALFDATNGPAPTVNVCSGAGQQRRRDIRTNSNPGSQALVDAGLLHAQGDKRGRIYTAAGPLREIRENARALRQPKSLVDPFAHAN